MELAPEVAETPEQIALLGRASLRHLMIQSHLGPETTATAVYYADGAIDYQHRPGDGPPNATVSETYLHFTTTVCNVGLWRTILSGQVEHDLSNLTLKQAAGVTIETPAVVATLDDRHARSIGLRNITPAISNYSGYSRLKTEFAFFDEGDRVIRTDHYRNMFVAATTRGTRPATANELSLLHCGLSAGGCYCRISPSPGQASA